MIASGASDVITALAGFLTAATAFVALLVNRVKLHRIHSDTEEINKAVNGKQAGSVSIQQQVQELYDHRPPEARNADAGLVLAVHAVLAKLEALERRLDK